MDKNELQQRTHHFAVRVFKLIERIPYSQASKVVSNQLLKAASSVAANYRAVNRAKSQADFINKLKIVTEEADESYFWLQFAGDVGLIDSADEEGKWLLSEANQLVAIFTAAVKTVLTKPTQKL